MTQQHLYPLVYKPGIKRDGTLFQADYCTDGQWIRFQRGNVRKMGGMKGINHPSVINRTRISNITILPSIGNDNLLIVYVAGADGIRRYTMTPDFNIVTQVEVFRLDGTSQVIWTSEIIIQANRRTIVFTGGFTRDNINNAGVSYIFSGDVEDGQAGLVAIGPQNRNGVRGCLYISPFLLIYGSNGLIQWSDRENPLTFTKVANQNRSVTTDKLIYAASIRGGVNTPVVLVWSLKSVIRLINRDTGDGNLHFDTDVLSNSTSILSSRSVISYGIFFFWPGVDRFFQYNGLVDEIPNNLSLNFFFNNVDLNYRELVCGSKNVRYGELWWFFPKKGQDPNALGGVRNNHALIYNVRENCWYDTAISRDAVCYTDDFGFMASYGGALTDPNAPTSLYRHEYEAAFNEPNAINEQVPNPGGGAGALSSNPIISFFTTPTISWAAFNPMKQLTGVNKWMNVVTLEPDFTLLPPPDPANGNLYGTDMTFTITSRRYAHSMPITSAPYRIVSPLVPGMSPLLAKVDTGFEGRHITFTFRTTRNFELGHIMLLLGIGDGQ